MRFATISRRAVRRRPDDSLPFRFTFARSRALSTKLTGDLAFRYSLAETRSMIFPGCFRREQNVSYLLENRSPLANSVQLVITRAVLGRTNRAGCVSAIAIPEKLITGEMHRANARK